jgi:pimeloyl-ACP methyl ester carboxylesterase
MGRTAYLRGPNSLPRYLKLVASCTSRAARSTFMRMRGLRLAFLALGLVLGLTAAASGGSSPVATLTRCTGGSTSATIAGRHVCLRAGARCNKRLDRAYHRYRFHCHSGRLTRFPAPSPPAKPPTLANPPAPVGELVDVGGYRLQLECVGSGSPTIVFEPGNTASRHGARIVQYALSTESRACSYDRPGTFTPTPSSSDPRPDSVPPTSETFTRELHTLLTKANVPGPYLLVGASFGGSLISAYTARHPADVAGLVFIDAVGPGASERLFSTGALIEIWDPRADLHLLNGMSFGSRPVVVLTTTLPAEAPDIQRRSSDVLVAGAPQYSHYVFFDVPGLAYETIRVALSALRSGGTLPKCADTVLPRIGARCTTP